MADNSLKTPTKVERIPKDDSFKTCKAELPSPKTRRQLRMTPARNSILSGGTPYKEVSSATKKFNSRTRHKTPRKTANDTAGSNETFIRCEQDLMFDRDSLEVGGGTHKYSSTPKSLRELDHVLEQFQEVALEPQLTKQPTFLKDKNHIEQDNMGVAPSNNVGPTHLIKPTALPPPKRRSPKKASSSSRRSSAPNMKKSPQKKTSSPRKRNSPKKTMMPPPAQVPRTNGAVSDRSRRQLFTPIPSYRKPASLKGTASRYLTNVSQWNSSRISRAQSFKSTAELERDYFRSLRSF